MYCLIGQKCLQWRQSSWISFRIFRVFLFRYLVLFSFNILDVGQMQCQWPSELMSSSHCFVPFVYNVKSPDVFNNWFCIFCLGCKIFIIAVSFRILLQTFSHSLLADLVERKGEMQGSRFHSREILQKSSFPRQKQRVCSAIRWTKTAAALVALVCSSFL